MFVDPKLDVLTRARVAGDRQVWIASRPPAWAQPGDIFHLRIPGKVDRFLVLSVKCMSLLEATRDFAKLGCADAGAFCVQWQTTNPGYPYEGQRPVYVHEVMRLTEEQERAMEAAAKAQDEEKARVDADKIAALIQRLDDGKGAAWEALQAEGRMDGLSELDVDRAIDNLLDRGIAYEPVLGKLRMT